MLVSDVRGEAGSTGTVKPALQRGGRLDKGYAAGAAPAVLLCKESA